MAINDCINSEVYSEYKRYKYLLFKYKYIDNNDIPENERIDFILLYEKFSNLPEEDLIFLQKRFNCINSRIKRIRDKLLKIFELHTTDNTLYFLTFTFNNDYLNSSTKDSRHLFIRRLLKKHCNSYIANIDYGKKNEREHYHAVVSIDTLFDVLLYKKYGTINFLKIYSKNEVKLSKYLFKLTYHAIKSKSTIIYSRNDK